MILITQKWEHLNIDAANEMFESVLKKNVSIRNI